MMTPKQLRQAAKERLDSLPPDQLKVAAEFIKYLQDRASEEATTELLKIPGLLENLKKAQKEIAEGKGTPVKQLHRKYKRNV